MMKFFKIIFLTILIVGCSKNECVTKARINPLLSSYTDDDCRWKFYNRAPEISLVVDVTISQDLSEITINNAPNDYQFGPVIRFDLDSTLCVKEVRYSESTDVEIAGVREEYTVEASFISLNQNPFETLKNFEGQYDLVLRRDYTFLKSASQEIKDELKDHTSERFSFHGKFLFE